MRINYTCIMGFRTTSIREKLEKDERIVTNLL